MNQVFPENTNGFFLDIGAWHPVKLSNTKALEEAGWSGVCIEPFLVEWKGRTCQLVKKVVYSKAGKEMEFRQASEFGGLDATLKAHRKRTETAKRIKVITSTIEQVLMETNAPKYIEYVSLDIEGAELEALKAFPFNEYKVGAWTIEHNFQEPRRSQILELLKQHGYRRVRSVKWDDWYLSHDLVAQKKRGGFVSP